MQRFLRRFIGCRSGATAIEYAMIGAFIAALIAVAVGAVGQQVSSLFNTVTGLFP